jgi:DNA repair protein RadA/Sms
MLTCSSCQKTVEKWMGQCPQCRAWNTLKDTIAGSDLGLTSPVLLHEIHSGEIGRVPTATAELDRVLGGGFARGGAYMLAGEPGAGKSTLLGQVALDLSDAECEDPRDNRILYVSTEETPLQIADRKRRLDPGCMDRKPNIWIYHENDLGKIEKAILEFMPGSVIIDSVGMLHHPNMNVRSGSIASVTECVEYFVSLSKSRGMISLLVVHITKDGSFAGPKAMEHLVDCSLMFEKERGQNLRTLHATKNRFGSDTEVGIFQMTAEGMKSVANPGALLFSRDTWGPGCVLGSMMKGSRALLVEVQALLAGGGIEKSFKRSVTGLERSRCEMLVAVVDRLTRASMRCDLWINVPGGMDIEDPACDLAVCASLLSSATDTILEKTLFIGEVGLGGEVRPIPSLDARLAQAVVMGIKNVCGPVVPKADIPEPLRKTYVGIPTVQKLAQKFFSVKTNGASTSKKRPSKHAN